MNILFWGITLGMLGKVLVVLAVLHMHHSLIKEHRIDRLVILTYYQERILSIIGLVLIVVGYLMEMYFYDLTPLFHCTNCAATVFNAISP